MCWGIHAISQFLEDSEMISINNVVPPLTRNVFDHLVANFIPGIWYTIPHNSIFVFNRGFIILENFLLGSLAHWFLIFTPKQERKEVEKETEQEEEKETEEGEKEAEREEQREESPETLEREATAALTTLSTPSKQKQKRKRKTSMYFKARKSTRIKKGKPQPSSRTPIHIEDSPSAKVKESPSKTIITYERGTTRYSTWKGKAIL